MQKSPKDLFDQIRVANLDTSGRFTFEIDLSDQRISHSKVLDPRGNEMEKLHKNLYPSFLRFIQTVANGMHIEIGNALTILPTEQKDYWTNIFEWTDQTVSDPLFPSKDFVFFAISGGDSEMFAFYTGTKFPDGEFPIVWFTPGSIGGDAFHLVNNSFDKFLTIQYYLLRYGDFDDQFSTYEEALMASQDKEYMMAGETHWQEFYDLLYSTFEPNLKQPSQDYYRSAVPFDQLIEIIEIEGKVL